MNTQTEENRPDTVTIVVYSDNKAGVLHRVTTSFIRRKINIESLTVSESEVPGIHRYTIAVEIDEDMANKVVAAIEKQIDVQKAFWYRESEVVYREIAMYKMRSELLREGSEALAIVDRHNARIVSAEPEFTIVQQTGRREATQQLFEDLRPFGILEFVRSGRIAISKRMKELKDYLAELDVAAAH